MFDQTQNNMGFLNLYVGGTGALAAEPFQQLWQADGRALPVSRLYLDTDAPPPRLLADGLIDAFIPVRLDGDQIRAVKATPQSFSPIVEAIVQEILPMLSEEDIGHGARTTRLIAQLFWEVRRTDIAASLNRCLREFMHNRGCRKVLPVLVGSSGGGTGSSLAILLAAALQERTFRSLVLQGFPDAFLMTPTAFVVEPFYRAIAHTQKPVHLSRILANTMGFRIESAYLESMGAFKTIYHLGLANSGGAVLDSEGDVGRVLGTTLYQFQKHYSTKIKARTVDTSDTMAISGRYRGNDTPEEQRRRPMSSLGSAPTVSNGAMTP